MQNDLVIIRLMGKNILHSAFCTLHFNKTCEHIKNHP